jgi:hypothetical protein
MVKYGPSGKYRDIYIFWGLHFSSFKTVSQISEQEIFENLLASFFMWLKKYKTTKIQEVKDNSVPVLNFITREITNNFTPQHLEILEKKMEVDFEEFINSLPPEKRPDSLRERGVID